MPIESMEMDEAEPASGFQLRPYQVECINAVREGWSEVSKQLVVMSGGLGKTVIFSRIAAEWVANGHKVLIIVHTEELIEQARDKLLRSTGIDADKEKADSHASPHAQVVVASVQTLSRVNRLTGFSDSHFGLVIIDEAHRGLSNSHLRIKNYFHHSAESLAEGWEAPVDGSYTPKARCLGFTATASRGDKRSLGEFYSKIAYEYGLLEAVREGYLVRPIVRNAPLKIDMRGIRVSRTGQGSDLDLHEVSERMKPVIREIAKQLAMISRDLKTVVFMPSVETARLLAEALTAEGMQGMFVSGACDDRDEKIAAFRVAGPGSILCNALLVVEGFDVDDITGVCVLRPTKIWSFAIQAWVRGTRTLTGLIDGLATKEARLAAIAGSAKPLFYIIDFLWLADDHELIQPADLVASKPGVKKLMTGPDLVASEEVAQRDFLTALAKAAKKHARKEARVMDPLAASMSLGDATLAAYVPQTQWERDPPTAGQLEFLRRNHIETSSIKNKGLASKVINRVLARLKHGLATVSQLTFMRQLGIEDERASTMTIAEATTAIDVTLKAKRPS